MVGCICSCVFMSAHLADSVANLCALPGSHLAVKLCHVMKVWKVEHTRSVGKGCHMRLFLPLPGPGKLQAVIVFKRCALCQDGPVQWCNVLTVMLAALICARSLQTGCGMDARSRKMAPLLGCVHFDNTTVHCAAHGGAIIYDMRSNGSLVPTRADGAITPKAAR